MIMSLKQKKIKIKPRIKLNHNIHILKCCYSYNPGQNNLRSFFFSFTPATSHNKTISKSAALRKEDPFPPSSTLLPTNTQGMRRSFRHNTTASGGWGCCGAMFRKMFFKYARLPKIVATLSISHFHTPHNAPYLPPKFCISIVFNFSWDDCNTQEK